MKFCALIFAVVLLVFPRAAFADDASDLRARTHFTNGVKLFDAKPPDYNGALAEFREAYAAKPSPTITRNIALCLRALHRYGEAIDALTRMVDEGGAALDPKLREAAHVAIDEMNAMIATVRVTVVVQLARSDANAARPKVEVFVDDQREPIAGIDGAIRLGPGEHVLRAHADGFPDAIARTTLTAGQRDVPVRLELVAVVVPTYGRLLVRTPIPGAAIVVDGAVMGFGEWGANVLVGKHRVAVMTYRSILYDADVEVTAEKPADVVVDFRDVEYPSRASLHPITHPTYAVVGFTYAAEKLTFGEGLDENGVNHSLTGPSLTLKIGRQLGQNASLEVLGELGTLSPERYASPNDANIDARVHVTTWVIAPEFRYRSRGKFRFIMGIALGVEGQYVSATLGESMGDNVTAKFTGASVALMGLYDLGVQFDIGPRVFGELSAFVDVHGVGNATRYDDQRFFYASPAYRFGSRFLLGYAF